MDLIGNVYQKIASYEQNGVSKARFQTLGAMFKDQDSGRIAIKMEALPLTHTNEQGDPEIWLNVFPRNENWDSVPETS